MKIVLVGASNNPEKYGNKILKDLISKGYVVYPVNPKENEIEGIAAYKDILSIKDDYDVVNFVTPPAVTLDILKNNLELIKTKKIWCQPGASDSRVNDFLMENNFKDYITDSCIMLKTQK
ncbi:MAG: CoA-binding protein [Candidatus Gracilibacteria bacterium]|nr:CoA-binding protein [Candidatus Gracilibacteria bacterium]